MRAMAVLGAGLIALAPVPAHAFCAYRGEMYAKTTLPQEFRDARWVVRAEVLSAEDWHPHKEGDWGTLYRLRVLDTYKGTLPRVFTFYTERNSGGFYFDLPYAGPDIGGQYLLFLVPNPRLGNGPKAAEQSLWVNYACGQSKRWSEVTEDEARQLRALAART